MNMSVAPKAIDIPPITPPAACPTSTPTACQRSTPTRNLSGTRSAMAADRGTVSMAYAGWMNSHPPIRPVSVSVALRISVTSAANTPPPISQGVRLPTMTRVWSDSVEMTGVTIMDSTAPKAMMTANGVASAASLAPSASTVSVFSPYSSAMWLGMAIRFSIVHGAVMSTAASANAHFSRSTPARDGLVPSAAVMGSRMSRNDEE